MKSLPGAHQSLGRIVCDRCGHKTESLDSISKSSMRQHIKSKHSPAETPPRRASEGNPVQ
ncbi:MAG: hypothetical protein JWM19_908 [Actinomycetia bacterium]|nr:hypothetical protein [Actinomycetes bacterium]